MKKFLAFIIVAIGLLGIHHVFAYTVTSNAITAGGSMSSPGSLTTTVDQTSTEVTVKYHFVGTPDGGTIKMYSWLGQVSPSKWIDRSNLLITIPKSTSKTTKDFSVTYNFAGLGLADGQKYVFYLATGPSDSDYLITTPQYFYAGTPSVPTFTFTATGQIAGTAAGTYQEGFTVKPNTALADPITLSLQIAKQNNQATVISQGTFSISGSNTASPGTDDLPPGAYVANLVQGTTNVGTANFSLTTAFDPFKLDISHIFAPNTAVTFDGVISAQGSADVPNSHLVVKIGTSENALTTAETAFSGTIPKTGVPFKVSIDSLDPTQTYYYKFTETTTGTDLVPTGRFIVNTSADQASGPAVPDTGIPTDSVTPTTTAPSSSPKPVQDTTSSDNPSNYLANPLNPALNTFPKILAAVMNNIVLPIMIPFISIMLIYCGFLFVIARKKGSTDGYAKAKKTLMYTIIGAALVLGATVVSNALQGTLNDLLGPSGSSTTTTTGQ